MWYLTHSLPIQPFSTHCYGFLFSWGRESDLITPKIDKKSRHVNTNLDHTAVAEQKGSKYYSRVWGGVSTTGMKMDLTKRSLYEMALLISNNLTNYQNTSGSWADLKATTWLSTGNLWNGNSMMTNLQPNRMRPLISIDF